MTDADRAGVNGFIRAMLEREALLFGDFVLKSGRKSPYFFNLGAVSDGAGHEVVGRAYAKEVMGLPVQPDVLFGPAYKGIPLAVATAVALEANYGINVGAAFNRKEAKAHGEGGTLVGAAMEGRRVAIVDDVVTDGAAKREAHEIITAAGGEVVAIVLALDRQEPSTDISETAVVALERDLDVPVRCVADVDDLVRFLAGHEELREQYRALAVLRVLHVLNAKKQRATYGAVAGLIGVPTLHVHRYLGKRHPEVSWVVNGQSGKPSGYAEDQMHEDLFSDTTILRSRDDLAVTVGWTIRAGMP